MKKSLSCLLVSMAVISLFTSCITIESPKNETTPSVTVTGESTIKVKPDVAYFRVSYETIKESSEEASESANAVINQATDIMINGYGLQKEDLETGYLSVGPYYEWVENERILKGQMASISIEVTDKDLDNLGPLIGELTKIDGITVGSISLDRLDKSSERMEARRLAAENALGKAEAYAEGVNAKIGRTLSIGGSNFQVSPLYANKLFASSASGAVEESADAASAEYYIGDVTISDSVTVVFELISQ